jgi:tetratricopeptide (TPR) repeat protein
MRFLALLFLAGCVARSPPVDPSLAGRRDCVKEMESVQSEFDFLEMGDRRRAAGDTATDPAEKKRQYRCALSAFQSATVIEQKDPEPCLKSADLYFDLRDNIAAAREYHKALELDPKIPAANLRLAQIARSQGDIPESTAYLKEEKRVNPKSAAAWVEQGNMDMSTRNFLAAETQFTRACHLDPKNRDALFGRAVARVSLGTLAGAETDLRAVNRLDPSFPDAYFQLGLVHEKMKNKGEAQADYRNVQKIDPDSVLAAQAGEKIEKLSEKVPQPR